MKPDFERVVKAVNHVEPDRLPLIEVLVDYSIQSKLVGREITADDLEGQVEFWSKAGYDYVPLVVGMMTPGKVTDNSAISKVIRDKIVGADEEEENWNLEYTSFIKDRRDFEAFPWDAASNVDISQFYDIGSMLPDGMKVVAVSGKIYTLAWMLMGFENFAETLLLDEQLAMDVVGKIAEIQIAAMDKILELPYVGAVWAVDDIAAGNGTILSPKSLRSFLFPWYKEMAKKCHDAGRMLFYHSDGDLRPVMEDLIGLGVDVLHPIDPTAMDIVKTKHEYGDRICLFGNVSTELLRSGSTAEVEAEVKRLIANVAPGGGYCLGSGNSVPDWVNMDNYRAMIETVKRFGSYPISCG